MLLFLLQSTSFYTGVLHDVCHVLVKMAKSLFLFFFFFFFFSFILNIVFLFFFFSLICISADAREQVDS